MTDDSVVRQVLVNSRDFKQFWKEKGPFSYALTSNEYPPVLLEDEEWIFSNQITPLLKALMQYEKCKMKVVKAPFNKENKSILRPRMLSSWKINHFPEEWNAFDCDIFVPEGHLTRVVTEILHISEKQIQPEQVETAFFQCLETRVEQLGYVLLVPKGASTIAEVKDYLDEWEQDEQEAGLL